MLKYLVISPVVEILGDELHRIGKHRYGVCEEWIMEKARAIEAKRAQARGSSDNVASSELEIQPPAWVVWNRPEGEPVYVRLTGRAYELFSYLLEHGWTDHISNISATIWKSSEDETTSIAMAQKGINDVLKKAEIPFEVKRENGYVFIKSNIEQTLNDS